jgi:hypothetical protein
LGAIETFSLEERVRRRAYELCVQRGNESGSEVDDGFKPKTSFAEPKKRPAKDD